VLRTENEFRAIAQGDALDKDAFAFGKGDHIGPEVIVLHHIAVWPPDLAVGTQDAAGTQQCAPLGGGHLSLFDGSPGVAGSVEDAFTGDGNILAAVAVDGRIATTVITFVGGMVTGELDEGARIQVQLYVTQQLDGAGEPGSRGYDDAAAAGAGAGFDRAGKSGCIERLTIAVSAEIGDLNIVLRDLRCGHRRHGERRMSYVPGKFFWRGLGVGLCRRQGEQTKADAR